MRKYGNLKLASDNVAVLDAREIMRRRDKLAEGRAELRMERVQAVQIASENRKRIGVHAAYAWVSLVVLASIAITLATDQALPEPPHTVTVDALRTWTRTVAWRVPLGYFMAGFALSTLIMHGRKMLFHFRRARRARSALARLS